MPYLENDEYIKLIRENERMKVSLANVMAYCIKGSVKSWRETITEIVKTGLLIK
jgi:hypothetical protein